MVAATQSYGQQLFAIVNGPAVSPYPTFEGDEADEYAALVTYFNQNFFPTPSPPVTDLRTDVYPAPTTYAPPNVYSALQNVPKTSVSKQILSEVGLLTDLEAYQNDLIGGANAIAAAWEARFQTASNTLDHGESGVIDFLGILGSIVSLLGLSDGTVGIGIVVGAFLSVADDIAGSIGVAGRMSELQAQMLTMVEQTATAAQDIYAPICTDWGKLQAFQTLASQSGNPSLTADDVTSVGDAYEIGIYQAVIPSTMAIVAYAPVDWGTCTVSSSDPAGLAYTPSHNGQNGHNAALCSRISALGVPWADVILSVNGWPPLDFWLCASTREGTYCTNEGTAMREKRIAAIQAEARAQASQAPP